MHIKYWFKTYLYRFTHWFRSQSKYHDPNYVHDRDKHEIRHKHYGKSGWKDQKQGEFRYRDYENYEEYVTHQVQKYDEILKSKGGLSNRDIFYYRLKFYRRFRHIINFLPRSAKILCAGSRQGTEVEVLHDIGYKNAFGVDLNPGPNNKYVKVGGFMQLENADSSLDMIYCNSIDHAFNLNAFFQEHARVIKPNGYVLYDIAPEGGGAFEAVEWESEEALFLLLLKYFPNLIKLETEKGWKWVLLQGKGK